jgi:hypothetical protein
VNDDKASASAKLVKIAQEIYTFGCASEERGGVLGNEGHDPVAVHTWAAPKEAPDKRRPLADIRPDLAAVYHAENGRPPTPTALGDAMMVIEGIARQAEPIEAPREFLELLAGKANVATQLIRMAEQRYQFGVSTLGDPFAVPVDGPNVARLLRGGRPSLRAELAGLYYEQHGAPANSQALSDTLMVLEGKAQQMEPTELCLRVGRAPDGRLVLDLGDDDGTVVIISPTGWEVSDRSPVLFMRTRPTLPLPVPSRAGSLGRLRELLNVTDEDWPLLEAWLVAALIPDIPHPVLLLKGEQGTAKSWLARMLAALMDPSSAQLRTAPRNVEDWAVAAAASWITPLDNVSDLEPWLQDAICRAVTGDGLLRRLLYTDVDVSVLSFRRVVCITSIDPGRLHGDLADRLLSLELERIDDARRQGDEEVLAAWRAAQPVALGGLLDLTVEVLRLLPSIRRRDLPRMADFGRVLLAVDELTDTKAYLRYVEEASRTAEQVADADSVTLAVRERITEPWAGTASELLGKLHSDHPPRDWPTTPQAMGGRLMRIAPTLRRLGWLVEQRTRSGAKGSRGWELRPPAPDMPNVSDTPTCQSNPAGPDGTDITDIAPAASSPPGLHGHGGAGELGRRWRCQRCGTVNVAINDLTGLPCPCGGRFTRA